MIKDTDLYYRCHLSVIGYQIQHTTCLGTLPFEVTKEEFWGSPCDAYDPLASIIRRIFNRNIYLRPGRAMKMHFQVLVAIYCILTRKTVNWTRLVMHAMVRCLGEPGAQLFFPRTITKIIGEKGLNLPLRKRKFCKLLYFHGGSFRRLYVSTF